MVEEGRFSVAEEFPDVFVMNNVPADPDELLVRRETVIERGVRRREFSVDVNRLGDVFRVEEVDDRLDPFAGRRLGDQENRADDRAFLRPDGFQRSASNFALVISISR